MLHATDPLGRSRLPRRCAVNYRCHFARSWSRDRAVRPDIGNIDSFAGRLSDRRIDTKGLPDGETVLCFTFNDLDKYKTWWLVIDGDDVDLCTQDTGKDVDLYVTSTVRTMIEIWEGDTDLRAAMRDDRVIAMGARHLIRSMSDWFGLCAHAHVRPASRTAAG